MDYIKIITAILIWSSLGIFIRKIELPNYCIIFYTSAIAGALQLVLLISSGLLKKAGRYDSRAKSSILLLITPLCSMANTMLFYFAFRNTTIANAVLSHYTAPVFVAVLAPIFLKERIHKITWLAITLSSIGLWLILGGKTPDAEMLQGNSEHLGIMAGALSGLAYAFIIIIIRKIANLYPSIFITFVQNGIIALLLLPFIINIQIPSKSVPYLVSMGILHSTIAPLLYVQGFRSVKANEAAILGYFEPVGAILLALIFFHETPGITALLGGMLILFSGHTILRRRGK